MKKDHNDQSLLEACKLYQIQFEQANLIRWNSNLIYDCGDKILRFTPSNIRSESVVEVELDWVAFFQAKKAPVVEVIPSIHQRTYELVSIPNQAEYFIVVCFAKIEGRRTERSTWTDEHVQKLGALTGKLHQLSQEYVEKPNLQYNHWNEIPEHFYDRHLPESEAPIAELYANVIKQIEAFPASRSDYGLVHYDIHHGNYLTTDEGQLIVFDFEMVCKSWYVNDVAIILYYAMNMVPLEERQSFEAHFDSHFWPAYQKYFDIQPEKRQRIPILLLYRDCLLYNFLCKMWGWKEIPERDQKFKNKIRQSIQTRAQTQGFSFS